MKLDQAGLVMRRAQNEDATLVDVHEVDPFTMSGGGFGLEAVAEGTAKRRPGDRFDPQVGSDIATARALRAYVKTVEARIPADCYQAPEAAQEAELLRARRLLTTATDVLNYALDVIDEQDRVLDRVREVGDTHQGRTARLLREALQG